MFPSDSPAHRLERYNAVYAGNVSDLPPYYSSLIPVPDQCSSIFHFCSRREGHKALPQGIQANPSMSRKRRLQRTTASFFAPGESSDSRGMAVTDRRSGAPTTLA